MNRLPKPPRGFRHVPGLAPGYAVNRAGVMISCRRMGNAGGFYKTWHRLRLILTKKGYFRIHARMPNGCRRKFLVHHAVLLAFVGPCPAGLEACHGNGTRTDNKLKNLRWDTRGSNLHDRYAHGRGLRGEMFKRSKLTEKTVRAIRASTDHYLVLAKRYRVHHNTIYAVRRHESWKHVK